MSRCLSLTILGFLVSTAVAFGDDAASPKPAPTQADPAANQPAAAKAAATEPSKTEEAKLLTAVKEALERNAQEIKALKEQYAKDMQEQQKKVAAQQAQIATLQQTAKALEDRLKATQAPNAPPGGQDPQGPDRQQKLTDIQQKQLKVLEEQLGLVADEVEKQVPALESVADPSRHAGLTLEARRPARPATRRRRGQSARQRRQPATQLHLLAAPVEGVVPAQRDQRVADLDLEHGLDAL